MSGPAALPQSRLPKYPKHGAGIGLHRVQAIAAALGLNLDGLRRRSCNVAGSSGKGSTATSLTAMLGGAGLKVGCFTSPHLFSIHERLRIDGESITEAALECHWTRVEEACDAYQDVHPGDAVGGFEFLYLVALDWFAEQDVDFAVLECGIGGRYDPTRLGRPAWACVVSVDLEHTELLGKTLAEIACDKVDTAPAGARLVLGDSLLALEPLLRSYCGLRELRPEFVRQGEDWEGLAYSLQRTRLRVRLDEARWVELDLPLPGQFQSNNVAIAARLAQAILVEEFALPPAEAAQALMVGARRVRWPGRMQTLQQDPLVVIDVGHTPRAVRLALAALRALTPGQELVLVCGVSQDKRAADVLAMLVPDFDRIVCTQAAHKGLAAEQIAVLVAQHNPHAECRVAPRMADACREALAWAGATPGAGVYVAGGLFLAIEFEAALERRKPGSLRFY